MSSGGYVKVVPNRCEGFGFCAELAGEIFQASDEGDVVILQQAVPDHLRPAAEAAVHACPVQAIRLSNSE